MLLPLLRKSAVVLLAVVALANSAEATPRGLHQPKRHDPNGTQAVLPHKRKLLTGRHRGRSLSWWASFEKDVSKDFKSVESTLSSWAKDVSSVVISDVDTLLDYLDEEFVDRDDDLWDEIVDGADDAWKTLLQGFDDMEDYVSTQGVSDLEWLGEKIEDEWDDLVCDSSIGKTVVESTCSYGLLTAFCIATDGVGPWCISTALYDSVVSAVSSATISLVVKCASYEVLKEIDSLCDGVAMSVAELIADAVTNNPFSEVCDELVSCSCDECMWTCDYDFGDTCDDWADGLVEIAEAVDELF